VIQLLDDVTSTCWRCIRMTVDTGLIIKVALAGSARSHGPTNTRPAASEYSHYNKILKKKKKKVPSVLEEVPRDITLLPYLLVTHISIRKM
jgi:hypothetical protein